MKKITVLLISFLLVAASGGSLAGWTVTGQVKVIRDSGGPTYGHFSAVGYGAGGTISQSVNASAGQYVFSVWCDGSGVFTLSNGTYSETKYCDPLQSWGSLTFIPLVLSAGNFTVTAQLQDGDKADMFCLYQVVNGEGTCPPSLFKNISFEMK
jgi:hypothetical protein